MSFNEGSIRIDVRTTNCSCPQVRTQVLHHCDVTQALNGQPSDSPLAATLIGSLHGLYPQAHLAAWRAALACACGTEPVFDNRRIAYEMMGEHLRFLAFDSPNAIGMAADPQVRRLGELRSLFAVEFAKDEPDWALLDAGIEGAIRTFVTDSDDVLEGLPELEVWIERRATAASRLFSLLWESVPCRGYSPIAMLGADTCAQQALEWMQRGLTVQSALIDGHARQTGAAARHVGHRLLEEIREQYSCGVRENFTARLIDLLTLWQQRNNVPQLGSAAAGENSTGLALVQCARGTLLTRVAVRDGRLADVAVINPTVWNFAPGGAADIALGAIGWVSPTQFRQDAGWILAALDPCMPVQFVFDAP